MKLTRRKWITVCLGLLIFVCMGSVQNAAAVTYPPITVTYTDFEWITNVTFGAINNATGAEGYGDFTVGMSASVSPGASYPLSVTIESSTDENISAFFDWNRDGDFTDPDEEVVVASLVATAGPHTAMVYVPEDAVPGDIRMRIVLSWNVPPVSFGIVEDGEAEDYTVYIPGPTITATAGENGSIVPAGITTFSSGDSQEYAITPTSGYYVADVRVDGISAGPVTSYSFTNITASHTIAATFALWPSISSSDYSWEWITNISFGAINNATGAEGYGDFTGGTPVLVSPGGSYPLAVTIFPDADENISAFFDWNIDGDFTDPGEEVPVASLVSTEGPHNATVNVPVDAVGGETRMRVVLRYLDAPSSSGVIDFGEAEDYTVIVRPVISATAGPGGSIDPAGNIAVNSGDTQAFTVTANPNYHVTGVSGCEGALVGDIYTTGPVTGNCTVTATFALDTYTLTYTPGANGTLSGSTSQTVDYGTSGTAITAVPDVNYHFVDWSDGLTDNPRTDSNVTADISVMANFALDTYTLTYTPGANGTLTGSTSQTVDYGTSGTAITAVPDVNYHFVDWSDGLTDNPRTDSNVTADISVTANFAINAYIITASAGANGSITPSGAVPVDQGSDQGFTITPDATYHVADVLVDGVSVGAVTSYTFTGVTADHIISASFVIDAYHLSVQMTGAGQGRVFSDPAGIDCQGDCGEDYDHDTTVTLTAEPIDGSTFKGWSGDCTGIEVSCTVTMDQARDVTASFSPFPWNLFMPAIMGNTSKP